MEMRFPIDLKIVPRLGDLVVVPEEPAPSSIGGDGKFTRLREGDERLSAHAFEVTLDDGRSCVVRWRVPDSGLGGNWFVSRWLR